MEKFSKLSRIINLFKYTFLKGNNLFIGDVLTVGKPISVKKNMYGGRNIKYKALRGQYCIALMDDLESERQEITCVSIHESIPLYRVSFKYSDSVLVSPLNSIIILTKDKKGYRKVDLEHDAIIGESIPSRRTGETWKWGRHGDINVDIITEVENLNKSVTMHDISMGEHHTFLTKEGVFLYDSAGLHVPITRKGIEDSLKMLPSRNLRWEPTGQLLTGPEHAAATGIYMLSKTKNGREEINKVLPAEYHITEQTNKPQLFNILTEIDKSKYNAGRIMNELRKIGDNYAFERGHTIGIEDISPLKELRDDILLRLKIDIAKIPEDERTQEKLQDIYLNYSRKASKELERIYKGGDNPIGTMLLAKARGSSSQFRDIVLTPIATMGGDLVDTPIEHSYAEGLLPWEYWSASAGARKGIIGRAQQTAMPGALAGELLATSNQLVVGDTKHQYMKSISLPIDNPRDLLDRYIGKAVRTRDGKTVIPKDTLITPKVIQRARKFNIKTLPAYSILGSSAPDGSLAAMSYGINKDGEKPEVGTNLGVIASHAIVDPLFTGSMQSFHTGSSLEDVEAGYPRVKQVLELQKELPKEAVLSSVDGEVDRITKDKLGGHFVYVNGEEHYIKSSNEVIIKIGDKMTKGDPLSNGPIQPGDLARLKSLEYAQNYMVEELKKEVPQAQRRAIETIVESITRHAKITDPGDTDYLPGDIDIISSIDEKNEDIANKAKYEYLFKGVNLLPQLTQGWASQLNFRHLKKQLRRNIAEGAEEEKHSYSPILSIMKGEEFGKGEKGRY